MRIPALTFCGAAAITLLYSQALAAEDRTSYSGVNCKSDSPKGRISIDEPTRFVNASDTKSIVAICPVTRQSFTDFPQIIGDLVEYAEILVSDPLTSCEFVIVNRGNFDWEFVPNEITPMGTKRMLIFGKGTINVAQDNFGFDSDTYFFRCTLPPHASIDYYSVTENEGED